MDKKAEGGIKEKLEQKLMERAAIFDGKSRITLEESREYNILGNHILVLRRKLYQMTDKKAEGEKVEKRVLKDRLIRRGYTGEAADRILILQGIK